MPETTIPCDNTVCPSKLSSDGQPRRMDCSVCEDCTGWVTVPVDD